MPRLKITVLALGLIALTAAFALAAGGPGDSLVSPKLGPETPRSLSQDVIGSFIREVGTAFLENQAALQSYKSWLISLPGISDEGFVESANFADTRSTTLLWAGSSALQEIAINEGIKRGIEVTIKPVKYNLATLLNAMDRLMSAPQDARLGHYIITTVRGSNLARDGLQVELLYTGPAGGDTPVAVSRASAAVQRLASGANQPASSAAQPEVRNPRSTGVVGANDISVSVTTEAPQPLAAPTRGADFAPFNAGGMMRATKGGSDCSTGYAIVYEKQRHITTARHCTDSHYVTWDNPPNKSYGSSIFVENGAGGRVMSTSGSPLMFDGTWDDSTGYIKTTSSLTDLSQFDKVCTSGAATGVHCNIVIADLLSSVKDGDFGTLTTILGISEKMDDVAVGSGDSGGPVLVPLPDLTHERAAGMIQAGRGLPSFGKSGCGSNRLGDNIKCYIAVEFTSMRTMINNIPGSSLVTGP